MVTYDFANTRLLGGVSPPYSYARQLCEFPAREDYKFNVQICIFCDYALVAFILPVSLRT